MNTRIDAMSKTEPKPPNKYLMVLTNQREGGADRAFCPYSLSRREACSFDKPCVGDVERRR